MMKALHSIVVAGAVVALAACQSNPVEEAPASTTMAPAERPTFVEGYALTQKNPETGEEQTWRIVSVEGDYVTGMTDWGCKFTKDHDWFSPTYAWENCGSSNPDWVKGTREVSATRGDLWPLEVGKTAEFDYTDRSSSGQTGTVGTFACEVESAVHITTLSGEHDAYKVVCRDPNNTRTWYWVPDVGEVAHVRTHKRRGREVYWNTVSTEVASSS